MAAKDAAFRSVPAPGSSFSTSRLISLGIRLVLLAMLDLFLLNALQDFFAEGSQFVAFSILAALIALHAIVLIDRLVPLRWLAPGLILLLLFTIAPIVYTGYVVFTNYDGNHLLSREQAVRALESQTYLAPDAPVYSWAAYTNQAGDLALWLRSADGAVTRFAPAGGEIEDRAVDGDGVGATEASGFPVTVDDYRLLTRPETVRSLQTLSETAFGEGTDAVRIGSLSQAAQYQQRYDYDESSGVLTDLQTGVEHTAREGTFTAPDGTTVPPSFQAVVGWDNFSRLIDNPLVRGPVLRIFAWTLAYAVIIVVVQFISGLVIALALNDKALPAPIAKSVRSILLLPYVVPGFLMILVWASMLNPLVGIVTDFANLFGIERTWWTGDPYGAKVSVVLVTLWIGFPYFVLILSGALQAISEEVLEAAEVDGASYWQRLRSITVPLLLRMTAPLAVLGFAGNFNNFVLIFLLTGGGPPITGATVPAGHTDLLLSFTYKAAFTFGQSDFGLAAVITMFIFVLLLPIVGSQFRYLPAWAED